MKYLLFFVLLLFPINCYADELPSEDETVIVDEIETENEEFASVLDENEEILSDVVSDLEEQPSLLLENDVPEPVEEVEPIDYSEAINDIYVLLGRMFISLQVCELCLICMVLLPKFKRISEKFTFSKKGGK